ncbi:MAG: deoxyribose-phosphate aldolase [Muribaculaceae bacterium]|jgi:deoxyribose-phosphate aldolase|nr:deoxyribose-phosphate aldolase [Muribaculaceae bacterium]
MEHNHDHCGCGCEHHHDHENESLDRYQIVVEQSQVTTDDAAVAADVQRILAAHEQENHSPEVYQFLLNCVDLTTLATDDSERSVAQFVQRVNDYAEAYPQLKNVAAICVYSNFAAVVRAQLDVSDVNIAVCSACFPSSQAHIETKVAETALAIQDGADEVDVVLNVGYFRDEAWEEMCDEIYELKQTIGDHHLKVILETGLLKTAANIRRASILAMHSGADFIKTSTGKVYSGATLDAAYVMCQCIKEFYNKTGLKVGFKASGGIRTTEDAVKYYTLVKEILGEEWLNNGLFRIGASSLANALFASMTGSDAKPF